MEYLNFQSLRSAHADRTPQARCPMGFEDPEVVLESGAVSAIGLRYSSFEQCEISQVGAHAATLLQGCSDNMLRRCYLHDLGGGGGYLYWAIPQKGKRPSWRPRGTFDHIAHNAINSRCIHDLTEVFNGSVGVLAGSCAAYNRITHNESSHGDYTGTPVRLGLALRALQGTRWARDGQCEVQLSLLRLCRECQAEPVLLVLCTDARYFPAGNLAIILGTRDSRTGS